MDISLLMAEAGFLCLIMIFEKAEPNLSPKAIKEFKELCKAFSENNKRMFALPEEVFNKHINDK